MARTPRMKTVQQVPAPEPHAFLDTAAPTPLDVSDPAALLPALVKLHEWASKGGDISDSLDPGVVVRMGTDAVRQWDLDNGSRQTWMNLAEASLAMAAQETDDEEGQKDYPFENASMINYPLLTVASQQFAARAYPELVKGDKVVGVKAFQPPPTRPGPIQIAKAGPQPQGPQEAQQATQDIQGAQQADAQQAAMIAARSARAERVKAYMNYVIFYRMDNWENETDQLLHEAPIVGVGFKKVYFASTGLCSAYVSATRLTVHNGTKSIWKCPRITQDYDEYPNDIKVKQRAGEFRNIDLPVVGDDPDEPRLLIEQHRLDDLDGDGLAEPYICTVDVQTRQVLRIEPAYTLEDIFVDEVTNRVLRIERWLPFPAFFFLPDPKGRFYGIGFGRLLASIMDSVDTSINQLIDAGNAEIAGGGFIASSVRLQGSGQGGSVFQRPGEYQTVSTNGPDLKQAIWERTVPHPSAVTMQLLEMLLAAAKDIAAVKDVISGEGPQNAPVGTTMALQNQALTVFSAIWKRMYRGFRDEFHLLYRATKRWATERERKEYAELTGGNLDEDFQGDGTDIQPIANPTVVTKLQKMARNQALIQLAESPVGIAAGMTQSGPAQEIVRDVLDTLEYDRPERFLAPVPPNPLEVAKAQDLSATAQLKAADAKLRVIAGQKDQAGATLDHAKALREVGLAAQDTHHLHEIADAMARAGQVAPIPEGNVNGESSTTSPAGAGAASAGGAAPAA
jgi:hypothetical protein